MARIHAEIDQVELQASQEVQAALARWSDARKWASAYQTDVLPELAKIKDEMEKQFAGKDPALDFGKFLAVKRSYLKATENLLDANFELSQAQVRPGPQRRRALTRHRPRPSPARKPASDFISC